MTKHTPAKRRSFKTGDNQAITAWLMTLFPPPLWGPALDRVHRGSASAGAAGNRGLNARQRQTRVRHVLYVLASAMQAHSNHTQAAFFAGYSLRAAPGAANKLSSNRDIQLAIDETRRLMLKQRIVVVNDPVEAASLAALTRGEFPVEKAARWVPLSAQNGKVGGPATPIAGAAACRPGAPELSDDVDALGRRVRAILQEPAADEDASLEPTVPQEMASQPRKLPWD